MTLASPAERPIWPWINCIHHFVAEMWPSVGWTFARLEKKVRYAFAMAQSSFSSGKKSATLSVGFFVLGGRQSMQADEDERRVVQTRVWGLVLVIESRLRILTIEGITPSDGEKSKRGEWCKDLMILRLTRKDSRYKPCIMVIANPMAWYMIFINEFHSWAATSRYQSFPLTGEHSYPKPLIDWEADWKSEDERLTKVKRE